MKNKLNFFSEGAEKKNVQTNQKLETLQKSEKEDKNKPNSNKMEERSEKDLSIKSTNIENIGIETHIKENKGIKQIKEEKEKEKIKSEIIMKEKDFKSLIFEIKSNYILKNIFGYVSFKKKLYLAQYSKSLQEKVNNTLKDYQERYLDTIIPLNNMHEYIQKIYETNNYDEQKTKRKEYYKTFLSNSNCQEQIIEEYIIKKIRKTI